MKQNQTELQREIDISTTIVGDSSTSCSKMDKTTKQKISKEKVYLNNEQALTYLQNTPEYVIFSIAMEHSPGQTIC